MGSEPKLGGKTHTKAGGPRQRRSENRWAHPGVPDADITKAQIAWYKTQGIVDPPTTREKAGLEIARFKRAMKRKGISNLNQLR